MYILNFMKTKSETWNLPSPFQDEQRVLKLQRNLKQIRYMAHCFIPTLSSEISGIGEKISI
jgi:hypothetical protein